MPRSMLDPGMGGYSPEALDLTLLYYRIGEDPRVLLPQYACQDGYFVSHIAGEVEIPDEGQVKEFCHPIRTNIRSIFPIL